MNREETDRPRWVRKLFKLIEKHWRHHGPCKSIHIVARYLPDSLAWEIEAAPAYQEVFGGEQDGQKVWTGFIFEAGEFSKESGLWLQDFAVASQCAACCPRPKMTLKGKFRGHNVFVTIRLEPEKGSAPAELLDTITREVRPKEENAMNQIQVIAPYWRHGTWAFSDPATGLVQEPFVSGVPEMIDDLVADIPNARQGFRLLFSSGPFPGFQRRLQWVREEMGGNWYKADEPPMEGWLCPALFRYFETAPAELYVKAEALNKWE